METPAAQAPASPKTHVLFPAVVREYQFGDGPLNRELYDRIKRFQADPTVANACHVRHIATTGGYQPDVVLHQALAGEPLWQRFMQTVVHPAIQGYLAEHCRVAGWPGPGTAYTITASWAVLYPAGAYQAPHNHRDIFCVLAYYPRVPVRPQPEGALVLVNPHPESTYSATKSWAYHHAIHPRNGTAVVFPGWLQHYAHAHSSEQERLLFTFDVKLLPASG